MSNNINIMSIIIAHLIEDFLFTACLTFFSIPSYGLLYRYEHHVGAGNVPQRRTLLGCCCMGLLCELYYNA